MPLIRYRLTEYDPDRTWIVVGQSEHEVDMPIDDFTEWARNEHPAPVYRVDAHNLTELVLARLAAARVGL